MRRHLVFSIRQTGGGLSTAISIFRKAYLRAALRIFGVTLTGTALLGAASASSATGGYVSNLSIAQDGSLWFSYTGTLSGSLPSCADPNGLWIVDPNQPGHEALTAALIAAQARHAMISIQGTGACYGAHESVAFLVVVGS